MRRSRSLVLIDRARKVVIIRSRCCAGSCIPSTIKTQTVAMSALWTLLITSYSATPVTNLAQLGFPSKASVFTCKLDIHSCFARSGATCWGHSDAKRCTYSILVFKRDKRNCTSVERWEHSYESVHHTCPALRGLRVSGSGTTQ